ncbi:MAG: ABC transporter substrate binding protein [Stellaceae bacterium]
MRSPSGRVRDHHRCRDHRVRRRWFIASLGVAALTLQRFATAQLPVRLAFLLNQLPPQNPPYWVAFVEVLRERGWDEGRNITFHLRAAEGSEERYQQLAAELVGLRPAVIIAANSQATQAARQLTNTIPIVMIGPSDPLGAGFIASLARPGGNITGLTNQLGDSSKPLVGQFGLRLRNQLFIARGRGLPESSRAKKVVCRRGHRRLVEQAPPRYRPAGRRS